MNAISKEVFLIWTGMAEKSQEVRDYLFPFLVSKNLMVEKKNSYYGFLKKPDTYSRWGTARIWTLGDKTIPCANVDGGKCEGYKSQEEINEEFYANIKEAEIDLIDDKRWAACLEHLTKMPTLAKPKTLQVDGGWRVAPRDVSIVALDWYKEPKEGTFKYTVVPGDPQTGAGDFIQYDPTSTPLEWPETVLNEFLWRLADRYGIFISNPTLSQLSKQQPKRA